MSDKLQFVVTRYVGLNESSDKLKFAGHRILVRFWLDSGSKPRLVYQSRALSPKHILWRYVMASVVVFVPFESSCLSGDGLVFQQPARATWSARV